jgi:chitodextrinase
MKSISGLDVRRRSAPYLVAILTLSVAHLCNAGTPAPPPAFQGLYNTLNGDLSAFNTTLNGLWNGSKYPVVFAGNLANANANTGPSLATSDGVPYELQALKAMGVQAVLVQVGFPVLYQPFFTYLSTQPGFQTLTYDQFATYYQQVAQSIRAAGLKLIIENNVLLANDVAAGWSPAVGQYYATLDWPSFQAARAQAALAVAQVMQPDYLVVLEEPCAQATQTGQANINTVSGATSLVNQILSALQPVRGSLKVGAGIATDQAGFQGFAQSFAGVQCSPSQPCVDPPGLDFVDMHIYPINNLGANQNFLQNALTIASIAASGSKPVTITEAWLWKMRNTEWNALPFDTIRGRNPFSFWAPLDAYFLQTMENLAYYTQMLFMAPEGPDYFWAYQTYNSSSKNLPPSQLLSQEITLANQANQVAAYTSTGMSYYNSLVSPPDTVPPSTPTILTASSGSSTTASLSWTASTDNVGVAGYYMWRNGKQLPTTALTMFQDSGLKGNTTYTYQVAAFDLGGNVSPQATVSITTQNDSPPNPPTNLAAVAVSGQQVSLTWTPPTGNVPVTCYLLFRGTLPTNLVQIQQLYSSDTSFNNAGLTPGTTYYYGLEAKSLNNLVSPMSNIAVVTTLAAPTAPTNLVATATSPTSVKLTWSPSTGSLPIANYHVYRGTSSSSLNPLTVRTITSYTDTSVASGTTYYYGVQAADTSQDLSLMSAIVSVTTP